MYIGFQFLNIRICMLLFYKPTCVFCVGIRHCKRLFAHKATCFVRVSTDLRVKRLMRSKRLMRTKYGFARKVTYALEAAYAYKVRILRVSDLCLRV